MAAYLAFKPRARLIRTIGDRLISGPIAAVIELVKNSHDADAESVQVIFEPPLREGRGRIIVRDNGHGMNLADIEQKWMEPATTDKVERNVTPMGRHLLGSKGIGRFAAARLGWRLQMKTTSAIRGRSGELQTILLKDIDWREFDKAIYLSDIKINYEVLPPSKESGTCLIIAELRDNWTRTRIEELHIEMRRMISPLYEEGREEFKIFLDLSKCTKANCGFDGSEVVNESLTDLHSKELHKVKPFPLLKSCDYEVEGQFDESGTFSGSMTIHRGDLKPEEITLSAPLDETERDERPCGIVLVHLFIFDRETVAVQNAMQRAGIGPMTARKAREILDQIAGVSIYRYNFRIRPYGDSNNDWLTLDSRRVQNPSMRIGHNQISGILVIDDEANSGLIERSSREGLEENGSFRRLRALITELLAQRVEPRRYSFRSRAGIDRRKADPFARAYETAELKWASTLADSLPPEKQQDAKEKIASESQRLTRLLQELGERQAILETKVTLGLILGEVLHEGLGPVSFLHDESKRLYRWWPTLLNGSAEAEERQNEVPGILRGMTVSAERLSMLFRSLRPLAGGRRGKPTYYNPVQVVLDTLKLFDSRIKEGGVDVDHEVDLELKDVMGYREDLAAATANIIDNSLYWLAHHRVKQPFIRIVLSHSTDHCSIGIFDNGPGIPEEFWDEIFNAGFTLKPNGTGLGLSIAREAVSRSSGRIALVDSEGSTCFRIELPYEVGQGGG